MSVCKILVVGSINMDLCLKTQRVPVAGENLLCDEYHYIHGGKGANQAVAAARLGAQATFVGCVGDDAAGSELVAALDELGIRTSYMRIEKNARSGLAVVILEKGGQNRILVYPQSNMKLAPRDIDDAFAEPYDAMIIQFEISREVVVHACKTAAMKGVPVIVDAGPARDFPIEEISGAEILSPNETETFAMTGIRVDDLHSAKSASRILMERSNARYIVIKAGAQGAYLYGGSEIKHFAAHKITAIDTTAAGDAFTAAMTLEYLKTGSIETAIKFAHGAGALAATKLGARPSMPTLREVEVFIKSRET